MILNVQGITEGISDELKDFIMYLNDSDEVGHRRDDYKSDEEF